MPGDREQDDKVASPVTACSSFVLIALSLSRISCASLLPGGCVCRTQVQVRVFTCHDMLRVGLLSQSQWSYGHSKVGRKLTSHPLELGEMDGPRRGRESKATKEYIKSITDKQNPKSGIKESFHFRYVHRLTISQVLLLHLLHTSGGPGRG